MSDPIPARAVACEEGFELRSPLVGEWRAPALAGRLVAPGDDLGSVRVLGRRVRLRVPDDARGFARFGDCEPPPRLVEDDALLVVLERAGDPARESPPDSESVVAGSDGDPRIFPAPMSGRFWSRPSPDRNPFAAVGGTVETGQTIALLEVMKTFTRVHFGGPGLPERARIVRIFPGEGDDVAEGAPLLEIEPL